VKERTAPHARALRLRAKVADVRAKGKLQGETRRGPAGAVEDRIRSLRARQPALRKRG
jgi:hypothetical protein